ncbi:hypothetical protein [uncultured Clostridium sp.]|uniref:hypothetical protein n=1 Tax=uncultured Clostridium sp. TaxID=59620 RepID=UPI002618B36D|nr:hypothetical protein [uncultured Clostridium sp.]
MLKGKMDISVDERNSKMLWINNKARVFGGFKNGGLNFKLIKEALGENEELLQRINSGDIETIVLGEINDELIREVVMGILARMNYLKDCRFIDLDVHSRDEVGMKNIAFIEDPIKEYLKLGLKFNVESTLNMKKDELDYFMCLCGK